MESIISISQLGKTYRNDWMKKLTILQDVSFEVPVGSCIGLLGHNGAGKTTTINIILGLIKPTSGHVNFNGKKISREHRRQIGYMPEVNKLPANLSCREILFQHIVLYRPDVSLMEARRMSESRLEEVGLKDHKTKKVRQLSKGMNRRLAWAMATIHEPQLLILDEPFSGLDPHGRKFLSKAIDEMRSVGKSMILCTHEMIAAEQLCEDVVILNKGRVLLDTKVSQTPWNSEIISNFFEPGVDPRDAYTAEKVIADQQQESATVEESANKTVESA